MCGSVGRRFLSGSAIAFLLTASSALQASPDNHIQALVLPPKADNPAARRGEPPGALPPEQLKALTGKDLVRAPLASSLSPPDAEVAAKLRDLLAANSHRRFDRRGERAAVEAFYRDRGFAPLWIVNGAASERARAATTFLRGVDADGLDPSDYPQPDFARTGDAAALTDDEVQLTSSILLFAAHARTGRIHFTRVSGAISYDLQFSDPAVVLATMATTPDIGAALSAYHPPHPGYRALKTKLAEMRGKAGRDGAGVRVPDGPNLEPGAEDMRVPPLRRRLNLSNSESWRYDDDVVVAVKMFQKDAGLSADGIIGARTLARLNAGSFSRAEGVDTILANMERWRWLPRDLGAAHVIVNIPDYTLAVFNRGTQVWSTRIVVGKPGTMATPLLSETMKYITVNPTWNVPPSIIRNEYLPVLERDPEALTRTGLKIGRNPDGSIRIYQPPGERNALGRIRFNFPNKFLVYQHDTPDKHLFAKQTRAFSHGCMRVQNPEKYAEVLLAISQPGANYTIERIRNMYGGEERTIPLTQHIPVHMTYQTAFVDRTGRLQIRKDIYGRDAEVLELLRGSERKVADVAIKRNDTANYKPVMARVPVRNEERPSRRHVRQDPEYRRGHQSYDRYDRYDRRHAGPSEYHERRGFFPFLFR